jgi:hypothetical protein
MIKQILSFLLAVAALFPVSAHAQMPDANAEMSEPGLTHDMIQQAPDLAAELGIDPEKFKGLAPEEILLLTVQEQMKKELQRLDDLTPDIPSLFFTQQQHALLENAMYGFEQNMDLAALRSKVGGDYLDTLPDGDDPFASMREIALGGIVYTNAGDWIVWLNKQRLTPKRLPPQIQDIKVQKGYIDVKWFDQQTKQLIPVRLRPNQRFNLDTRVFLPG